MSAVCRESDQLGKTKGKKRKWSRKISAEESGCWWLRSGREEEPGAATWGDFILA
jgi:hypothetical protein